ncbi:putative DNA repair and recombination protein RAD54B [Apostichopus japonicus]|uniref:Putative DNA repair and recombination protein RAD54B n=1 Tax=Stichopus japonicus TaxID=307972 RepID=A0A2G8JSJ3_STIJA|nr:putative DNA repair and recombination protein RAD54B [Apostichopus japonicus]
MRRSAAPSQIGNAAKRGRFVPPFRASFSSSTSQLQASSGQQEADENTTKQDANPASLGRLSDPTITKRNVLSLIQGGHNNTTNANESGSVGDTSKKNILLTKNVASAGDSNQKENAADLSKDRGSGEHAIDASDRSSKIKNDQCSDGCKQPSDGISEMTNGRKMLPGKRTFKAPVQLKQTHSTSMPVAGYVKEVNNTEKEDDANYYSVMWCKRSKKKHKKWEGDAVMIARGKSVSLLDMDGKEIGKGSGYKVSEIQNMEEGQSLFIGGKEIEVMGRISRDDFRAGKCFQSAVTNPGICSKPRNIPVTQKGFTNPQKSKMMWQNNNSQSSVVDVVVDPYLVSKLRHIRGGVVFMYECTMGMRGFSGNGVILADDMGLGKTLQCITLIWLVNPEGTKKEINCTCFNDKFAFEFCCLDFKSRQIDCLVSRVQGQNCVRTLFQQGPYGGKPVVKRILVVTPGSLVKNWCREFNKWLGKERMNVFGVASDNKVKEFQISTIYPVMVVSYEMMVRYADDIRKIKFDLMVCDEAHRLKNNTIKTTSILTSLDIKKRILLTGTPIQNDLQEFYSLAEFCNPSILGTSNSFHRLYEEPVLRSRQPDATEEEKKIGETRANELSRITSLFVLRRTQEINNKYLPPKVEAVIFCSPKPLQISLYKTMLTPRWFAVVCLVGFRGLDSTYLICIGALKKLCNHPLALPIQQRSIQGRGERRFTDIHGDEQQSLYDGLYRLYPPEYETCHEYSTDSGKLTVLASMLRSMHSLSSHERIVIVSNYTQTLDLLQKFCEGEGYCVSRLDGSTPTSKRQQLVERFNSKYAKETVFLLSSKAGGVGLNLIGASRLILYDIDWNPANDLQAMARVWRDGQKKMVYIYRLITAGTIEEKVYQRQISKQGLSGAVVDMTNRSEVKFSLEELKNLFTLHENASCLTHDMLDCQCAGMGETEDRRPDTNSSDPLRPCQLGRRSDAKKNSKNISMAKLLKWKHHKSPFQHQFEDPLLSAAQGNITFIFQNETNAAEMAT